MRCKIAMLSLVVASGLGLAVQPARAERAGEPPAWIPSISLGLGLQVQNTEGALDSTMPGLGPPPDYVPIPRGPADDEQQFFMPLIPLGLQLKGEKQMLIEAVRDEGNGRRQQAARRLADRFPAAAVAVLSEIIEHAANGYSANHWISLLGGLSDLGFHTVMIRLIPEYRVRGEWALLRGLLNGGRALTVTLSSAVMLAGLAVLHAIGDGVAGPFALGRRVLWLCRAIGGEPVIRDVVLDRIAEFDRTHRG